MYTETMFRVTPLEGMGNSITEAPNSAEAIKLAGLDWNETIPHGTASRKFY